MLFWEGKVRPALHIAKISKRRGVLENVTESNSFIIEVETNS